ncbi:MAG: DegT/DnrJ/EryC1/StrS aminotransferase family protein, partial [Planctomycetes bacterium]|nr:DegT/DnrJ/EryC1/StrS aminotransferase family protein [Planctomycetota bacterium]
MSRHRIPHSRPTLGPEEERAALRVLRSGMLGGGEEVDRFERELERRIGSGRAVAVHTGSAALHLALLGLGVGAGDRVVVPSYTCAAVLNAVMYAGAEPILADVLPETANLDPDDVRVRLRAGTKAIIAPHMMGRLAPIRELRRLGAPVVEDCAMALGGEVGREGEVSVFSFYATKMMATGHGGAVLARDRVVVRRIADLVEYDNRDDYKVRHNYRMSALVAALGRAQLAKLADFVKRRRRIADYYRAASSASARCTGRCTATSRRPRGSFRVRKNCIETGRPSPSIPPSTEGRGSAWRRRFANFFARWLRFSTGLYISLAFALLVAAQEGGPKERVRFLDGKAELCEIVAADGDGITLRLSGIPQPLKFRWWQLAAEDATRLRDFHFGKPAVSSEGEFLVPGLRIRTTDDK